jgi:hypothetical protein
MLAAYDTCSIRMIYWSVNFILCLEWVVSSQFNADD